jgi:phosphate transport system substrate-binding protein
VTSWTQHYKRSQSYYSGIGSGGGIAAISARTVDFGASDAPLTPTRLSLHGLRPDPVGVLGHVDPVQRQRRRLRPQADGHVIAAIYGGSIKYWDNPAIKRINQGVNLPHEKVVPIYRSDGSGTSYNFTDYLSHVSKAWKNSVGKGTQPSFPSGVGAAAAREWRQAAEHARRHHVRRRRLLAEEPLQDREGQNRAGKFQLPGSSRSRRRRTRSRSSHSQNAFTAVDPNPRAKNAYPICTFTWVIVPLKTGKAAELKKVRRLGAHQGPVLRAEPAASSSCRRSFRRRPARPWAGSIPRSPRKSTANVEPRGHGAAGFDGFRLRTRSRA